MLCFTLAAPLFAQEPPKPEPAAPILAPSMAPVISAAPPAAPAPASIGLPLPVGPAPIPSRLPQAVASFYNNNPNYPWAMPESTKPLWAQNLVKLGFKVYAPTFSLDGIFLADGARVVRMDPTTGKIAWEKTFDRDVDQCLADGDLFLRSAHRAGLMGGKSWLIAKSLSSGKTLWTVDEPWHGANLQAFDGHIYRYSFNGLASFWLNSYDREGKKEWEYKSKGYSPLFFFDDLVVTAPPGLKKLVALRRKDGGEAWTLELKHASSDNAFQDGVFYISWRTWNPLNLPGGSLYVTAMDLRTGKSLWDWSLPADDGWFPEHIGGVVTDGKQCVLNTSRHLFGLNAKTGELLWTLNPEEKQKFLPTKPIVLNGTLCAIQTVKDEKSIFMFVDLGTGKELGRATLGDEVVPPAKVVGKTLFVCFRHGDMIALPLVDPKERSLTTTP
jgi:outer membrane protein assembly factor BamB